MISGKNSVTTLSTWGEFSTVTLQSKQSAYVLRTPVAFVLITILILFEICETQTMAIKGKERIVFFGDSITEQGEKPNGYVALLRDTLGKQYPGIRIIGAGVSGNKVPQLLDRVDHDVIAVRPTIVVIYIGINDVWHFEKHGTGTPKDIYESGMRELITRIRTSGAQVILCTPSVIGEKRNGKNKFDTMLDEYSAISRRVAHESGAKICDLRKSFISYLATHNPDNNAEGILTLDSVHLNDAGNRLVTETILKTLTD